MHGLLNLFKEFALKKGIADDVYIVGGAVRDMLKGIETKDIDLAIAGDAPGISKEFAHFADASFVLLDAAFGIARVVKGSGFLDISVMRGPSITADLAGRDITVNAMALPLCATELASHIIDPYGGEEDLKTGTVRMVSEKNLVSDPLRILRIYRFSAVLHASIEINTRDCLKKHYMLLMNVAVERIADELRHIMALGDSREILGEMEADNIVPALFPEFLNVSGIGIRQGVACYGHCESILGNPASFFNNASVSIASYFGSYFDIASRRICLKLAALFSGAADALKAASRLKMSKKETALIESVSSGCRDILAMAAARAGKAAVVSFLKSARDEVYPMAILAVATGSRQVITFCDDMLGLYVDEVISRLPLLGMISGDDLIREFRLAPSPQFKIILSELEDNILNGDVRTREEALKTAAEIISRISRT